MVNAFIYCYLHFSLKNELEKISFISVRICETVIMYVKNVLNINIWKFLNLKAINQ